MTTYTITESNGCRLVSGSVPLSAMQMLCHGMPKGAVMDAHAARLLGVTLAIGLPEELKALISSPGALVAARIKAETEGAGLSAAAKEWLATGKQGISSVTIFNHLTGKKVGSHDGHPFDPDDLGRCRLLLELVPEFRPRLGEMDKVSPAWEKLVAHWDVLCSLMDDEAPEWRNGKGSATQTYARMKDLIG